jgi:hypothetical protein
MRLSSLRTLGLLVLSSLVIAAAPVRAASPSTAVAGVVVAGGPPPKVASTYPANGSAIPAGILILKIIFDQAMTPDQWSYGHVEGAQFPLCLANPRLLSDQRTFVLLCKVVEHQNYAIAINSPKDFQNQAGRSANPTVLQFSTTVVGPRSMQDALGQAGLTDVDAPIMTWRDAGVGVSQPPSAGN